MANASLVTTLQTGRPIRPAPESHPTRSLELNRPTPWYVIIWHQLYKYTYKVHPINKYTNNSARHLLKYSINRTLKPNETHKNYLRSITYFNSLPDVSSMFNSRSTDTNTHTWHPYIHRVHCRHLLWYVAYIEVVDW